MLWGRGKSVTPVPVDSSRRSSCPRWRMRWFWTWNQDWVERPFWGRGKPIPPSLPVAPVPKNFESVALLAAAGLRQIVGVEHDGERPVVYERYLHVGSEFPMRDNGDVALRSLDERAVQAL